MAAIIGYTRLWKQYPVNLSKKLTSHVPIIVEVWKFRKFMTLPQVYNYLIYACIMFCNIIHGSRTRVGFKLIKYFVWKKTPAPIKKTGEKCIE